MFFVDRADLLLRSIHVRRDIFRNDLVLQGCGRREHLVCSGEAKASEFFRATGGIFLLAILILLPLYRDVKLLLVLLMSVRAADVTIIDSSLFTLILHRLGYFLVLVLSRLV